MRTPSCLTELNPLLMMTAGQEPRAKSCGNKTEAWELGAWCCVRRVTETLVVRRWQSRQSGVQIALRSAPYESSRGLKG